MVQAKLGLHGIFEHLTLKEGVKKELKRNSWNAVLVERFCKHPEPAVTGSGYEWDIRVEALS